MKGVAGVAPPAFALTGRIVWFEEGLDWEQVMFTVGQALQLMRARLRTIQADLVPQENFVSILDQQRECLDQHSETYTLSVGTASKVREMIVGLQSVMHAAQKAVDALMAYQERLGNVFAKGK